MDKKRILIIGANGKIGKLLSEKLAQSPDFEPIAAIRKEEQAGYFSERGIAHRLIDLEGSVARLQEGFDGVDSIIFTAGSGGHTGLDKTLAVDLDGAVKSIEAAKSSGVNRYIMVSALHAGDREAWDSTGIKPYYIAKHYADKILKNSGLQYTILRPARLLDGEGTGKVSTNVGQENDLQIFREDVADVILEALSNQGTVGKTINLINGNLHIPEALAELT